MITGKIGKAVVHPIHSISVACVGDKFVEYWIPNHSEVELPIMMTNKMRRYFVRYDPPPVFVWSATPFSRSIIFKSGLTNSCLPLQPVSSVPADGLLIVTSELIDASLDKEDCTW